MSTDTRPESAPLPSNPAPAVDVLRRLVETWEAKAEDTIGENVLALGPLMVEGRRALDVAARHATPELDVKRLGHAMEDACDRLSVWSLSPADASVLAAAYAQAGDAVEAEREEQGR